MDGQNNQFNNSLIQEIFLHLSLYGYSSNLNNNLYLLFNECKNINNPMLITIIFMIEEYVQNNILLSLLIKNIKNQYIINQIELFDNDNKNDDKNNCNCDNNNDNNINQIVDDQKFFDYTPTGKVIKNKDNLPAEGNISNFRVYNSADQLYGVEYTINHLGQVIDETIITPKNLDEINIEEIYLDELDSILNYEDFSEILDEEILLKE